MLYIESLLGLQPNLYGTYNTSSLFSCQLMLSFLHLKLLHYLRNQHEGYNLAYVYLLASVQLLQLLFLKVYKQRQ